MDGWVSRKINDVIKGKKKPAQSCLIFYLFLSLRKCSVNSWRRMRGEGAVSLLRGNRPPTLVHTCQEGVTSRSPTAFIKGLLFIKTSNREIRLQLVSLRAQAI